MREIELALPSELTKKQNISLARNNVDRILQQDQIEQKPKKRDDVDL